MQDRTVIVANIVKEMHLGPLQKQSSSNTVHWGVSPSLVKEATCLVKMVKVRQVLFRSKPVQWPNLKIAPEMAHVVGFTMIVRKPVDEAVRAVERHNVVGMFLDEIFGSIPECGYSEGVFTNRDGEA